MSNITLSAAVRSNLLSLQNTATLLDTTQTRLATGNKVNSALDNPTSYFTASALNSRASDLGNLLDSVSNAVQTIQAANDGITSITKLVESAQATANQAQQLSATVDSTSGAITESDATTATSNTTSLTIAGPTTEADVSATSANTTSLTIHSAVTEADVSATSANTTSLTIHSAVTEADATAASSNLSAVTIHSAVTEVDATQTTADISGLTATGGTITINGQSVVIAPSADQATIATALQGGATAGGYTVTDNSDGTYGITSNGGHDLVFGGDTTTLSELGVSGTTTGTQPVADTTGDITINGQTISLADGNTVSDIYSAINTAAGTATGTNAFSVSNTGGTLTLTGTGGNNLVIGGNAATLSALGLSNTTVTGTPPVTGTAGAITVNGQTITLADGDTSAQILTKFQNASTAAGSGASAFGVSNASGVLTITGTGGNDLAIAGNASTLSALGLTNATQTGTPPVTGTAGAITVNGQTITLADGDTSAQILTKFQNASTAAGSGANAFGVSNASGVLTITGTGGDNLAIAGNASTLTALGLTAATQTGTPPAAGTAGAFTINGQTVTLAAGDNSAAILTKLQNAANASTGTNAFTVGNASGVFTITGTGGNDVTTAGSAAALGALGLTATTVNGTPASTGTTTPIANPARAALITQYNGLLDQIDQLTADAGYNGNNLLAGSSTQLKVVFNETGTSSLTVSGKDASSTGLGLTALTSTAFDTNDSITTILGTLKSATDTLRSDASSFGSNLSIVQTRQDFTKALINTLQTGASNLTLADSNEEAANLLALQTRQSLSTKALSLASQSDQNVLRLLQ